MGCMRIKRLEKLVVWVMVISFLWSNLVWAGGVKTLAPSTHLPLLYSDASVDMISLDILRTLASGDKGDIKVFYKKEIEGEIRKRRGDVRCFGIRDMDGRKGKWAFYIVDLERMELVRYVSNGDVNDRFFNLLNMIEKLKGQVEGYKTVYRITEKIKPFIEKCIERLGPSLMDIDLLQSLPIGDAIRKLWDLRRAYFNLNIPDYIRFQNLEVVFEILEERKDEDLWKNAREILTEMLECPDERIWRPAFTRSIESLRDKDKMWNSWRAILEAIMPVKGDKENPQMVRMLVELLNDSDRDIRLAVVLVLRELKPKKVDVIGILQDRLDKEDDVEVKEAIESTLRIFRGEVVSKYDGVVVSEPVARTVEEIIDISPEEAVSGLQDEQFCDENGNLREEFEFVGKFPLSKVQISPIYIYQSRVTGKKILVIKGGNDYTLMADYIGLRFFKLFGLPVPRASLVRIRGRVYLATEYMEGYSEFMFSLPEALHKDRRIMDGVLLSIMLGDNDRKPGNIISNGKDIVHIDFGASLFSRATGGFVKFPLHLDRIELERVLNVVRLDQKAMANEAYSKAMKDPQLLSQLARKVGAITNTQIRAIVRSSGMPYGKESLEIVDRWIEQLQAEGEPGNWNRKPRTRFTEPIETFRLMKEYGGIGEYVETALINRRNDIVKIFGKYHHIDLHCHTTASDGLKSPKDVVMEAKHRGLLAIGITDHNTFGGWEEAIKAGDELGVEIVPGIEIDVYDDELDIDNFHLLVYFPKENVSQILSSDFPVIEDIRRMFEADREKDLEIIRRFNQVYKGQGLEITNEDIQSMPSLPNIYRIGMVLFNKYGRDRLGVKDYREATWKYIRNNPRVYMEMKVKAGRNGLPVSKVMEIATRFGGVVVLAHPFEMLDIDKIKKVLSKYPQIKGIEVYSSKHSKEEVEVLRQLVGKDYLITCGSDCHNEEGRGLQMAIGQVSEDTPEGNIPYSVAGYEVLHRLKDMFGPVIPGMRVAVIGTGYVGLVHGAVLSSPEMGNRVTCVDADKEKISRLKSGDITIYEPGLKEVVYRGIKAKRLDFTTDVKSAIEDNEIIFIAVGTPQREDGSADLRYVEEVARSIGRFINGYKVIVIKSTVPPGAHRLVRSIIEEEIGKRGVALDFDIVVNPEFLREGSAVKDTIETDRIVLGVENERARKVMEELYRPWSRKGVPLFITDPVSAMLIKYGSNCLLASEVSFIGEIALLSFLLGGDIVEISRRMREDPRIGEKAFITAGIGYGGSCFPKDTEALIHIGQENGVRLSVVKAVQEFNRWIRHWFSERIETELGGLSGRTIAVLGLAFKENTDDVRDSPALDIVRDLLTKGACVRVYDPIAMENAKKVLPERVIYTEDPYSCVEGADAMVIATRWGEFKKLDLDRIKGLLRQPVVFDGKNIFMPDAMQKMGFRYFSIGRPLVGQDAQAKVYRYRDGVLKNEDVNLRLTGYGINAFLAMQIAFAGQLAQLCERLGGNIDDVVRGIKLDKRIGTRSVLEEGIGYNGSYLFGAVDRLIELGGGRANLPVLNAVSDFNKDFIRRRRWLEETAGDKDIWQKFRATGFRGKIRRSFEVIRGIKKPLKVSIVIPTYGGQRFLPKSDSNPYGEDSLRKKVAQLELCRLVNPLFSWELVVVDDGSPGNRTGKMVEKLWGEILEEYRGMGIDLSGEQLHTLYISPEEKKRLGAKKGGAVHLGMEYALKGKADIIFYTDVDISTDLRQVGLLIEPLLYDFGIAVGSRWLPDSVTEDVSFISRLSSKIYNLIVRLILPIGKIKDTQRGFKAFKPEVVERILPYCFDKGLSFDTELLLLGKLAGYKIAEVPIAWFESQSGASSVSLKKDVIPMLKGAWRQRRHLKKDFTKIGLVKRRVIDYIDSLPLKELIYVFDIDGTLCERSLPIDRDVAMLLIELLKKGLKVRVVTGRSKEEIEKLGIFKQLVIELKKINRMDLLEGVVIYTSYGAGKIRMTKEGGFIVDTQYNYGFTDLETKAIEEVVKEMAVELDSKFNLTHSGIFPYISVSNLKVDFCPYGRDVDQYDIRRFPNRLSRNEIAETILLRLQRRGITNIRYEISGASTIGFLRADASKENAILDILKEGEIIYFGDEVAVGNDKLVGQLAKKEEGIYVVSLDPSFEDVSPPIIWWGGKKDGTKAVLRRILGILNGIKGGPRIVSIGGGNGPMRLAKGMTKYTINMKNIITVFDNGGSTGSLRDAFDIPAVGDLRNRLGSLLDFVPHGILLKAIFEHRIKGKIDELRDIVSIKEKELGFILEPYIKNQIQELINYFIANGQGRSLTIFEGLCVGNAIITALYFKEGKDLQKAMRRLVEILEVNNYAEILPVSNANMDIAVEFEDGSKIYGESQIVHTSDPDKRVKRLFFVERGKTQEVEPPVAEPSAIESIKYADAIVLGPGSLYTSCIPNLMVKGVADAIRDCKGPKILVVNLLQYNQRENVWETKGFKASDVAREVMRFVPIDYVLVNNHGDKEGYIPVDMDGLRKLGVRVVVKDLEDPENPGYHHPDKLARAIMEILKDRNIKGLADRVDTLLWKFLMNGSEIEKKIAEEIFRKRLETLKYIDIEVKNALLQRGVQLSETQFANMSIFIHGDYLWHSEKDRPNDIDLLVIIPESDLDMRIQFRFADIGVACVVFGERNISDYAIRRILTQRAISGIQIKGDFKISKVIGIEEMFLSAQELFRRGIGERMFYQSFRDRDERQLRKMWKRFFDCILHLYIVSEMAGDIDGGVIRMDLGRFIHSHFGMDLDNFYRSFYLGNLETLPWQREDAYKMVREMEEGLEEMISIWEKRVEIISKVENPDISVALPWASLDKETGVDVIRLLVDKFPGGEVKVSIGDPQRIKGGKCLLVGTPKNADQLVEFLFSITLLKDCGAKVVICEFDENIPEQFLDIIAWTANVVMVKKGGKKFLYYPKPPKMKSRYIGKDYEYLIASKDLEDMAREISTNSGLKYGLLEDRGGGVFLPADVKGKDCIVLHPFRDNEELVRLFLVLYELLKINPNRKVLCIIPYFAYARQHKNYRNQEGEVSSNSACTILSLLDRMCDGLVTFNIHFFDRSGVQYFPGVEGLPICNINAFTELIDWYKKNVSDLNLPILIAPDKGAFRYVKECARSLGFDCDYLIKKRLTPLEVVLYPKAINVQDRDVIILDDIIATGKTMVEASKMLKGQGARRVFLGGVHGGFYAGTDIFSDIDGVICTDSLPGEKNVVSLIPLLIRFLRNPSNFWEENRYSIVLRPKSEFIYLTPLDLQLEGLIDYLPKEIIGLLYMLIIGDIFNNVDRINIYLDTKEDSVGYEKRILSIHLKQEAISIGDFVRLVCAGLQLDVKDVLTKLKVSQVDGFLEKIGVDVTTLIHELEKQLVIEIEQGYKTFAPFGERKVVDLDSGFLPEYDLVFKDGHFYLPEGSMYGGSIECCRFKDFLNNAIGLFKAILEVNPDLKEEWERILGDYSNNKTIWIRVNRLLPENSCRIYRQREDRVEIVFNLDFITDLMRFYEDPGFKDVVLWLLVERLFHEFGHNNTIGNLEEEKREEKRQILRDIALNLCIPGQLRDRIRTFFNTHIVSFRSGYYFRDLIEKITTNLGSSDIKRFLNGELGAAEDSLIDRYLERIYRSKKDFQGIDIVLPKGLAGYGDIMFIYKTAELLHRLYPDKKMRMVFFDVLDFKRLSKIAKMTFRQDSLLDFLVVIDPKYYYPPEGVVVLVYNVNEKVEWQDVTDIAPGAEVLHNIGEMGTKNIPPTKSPRRGNFVVGVGKGEEYLGMPFWSKKLEDIVHSVRNGRIRKEDVIRIFNYRINVDIDSRWGFIYAHHLDEIDTYFKFLEMARAKGERITVFLTGVDKKMDFMDRQGVGSVKDLCEKYGYRYLRFNVDNNYVEEVIGREDVTIIELMGNVGYDIFLKLLCLADNLPSLVTGQNTLGEMIYISSILGGRPFFWQMGGWQLGEPEKIIAVCRDNLDSSEIIAVQLVFSLTTEIMGKLDDKSREKIKDLFMNYNNYKKLFERWCRDLLDKFRFHIRLLEIIEDGWNDYLESIEVLSKGVKEILKAKSFNKFNASLLELESNIVKNGRIDLAEISILYDILSSYLMDAKEWDGVIKEIPQSMMEIKITKTMADEGDLIGRIKSAIGQNREFVLYLFLKEPRPSMFNYVMSVNKNGELEMSEYNDRVRIIYKEEEVVEKLRKLGYIGGDGIIVIHPGDSWRAAHFGIIPGASVFLHTHGKDSSTRPSGSDIKAWRDYSLLWFGERRYPTIEDGFIGDEYRLNVERYVDEGRVVFNVVNKNRPGILDDYVLIFDEAFKVLDFAIRRSGCANLISEWDNILNQKRGREIIIRRNKYLRTNSAVYIDKEGRIVIVFDDGFLTELLNNEKEYLEVVVWLLAERLFHELGHSFSPNLDYKNEEFRQILRDLALYILLANGIEYWKGSTGIPFTEVISGGSRLRWVEETRVLKQEDIDKFFIKKRPFFKSGYYFRDLIGRIAKGYKVDDIPEILEGNIRDEHKELIFKSIPDSEGNRLRFFGNTTSACVEIFGMKPGSGQKVVAYLSESANPFVSVNVRLTGLNPDDVKVEIHYGRLEGEKWVGIGDVRMDLDPTGGKQGIYQYRGRIPFGDLSPGVYGFTTKVTIKNTGETFWHNKPGNDAHLVVASYTDFEKRILGFYPDLLDWVRRHSERCARLSQIILRNIKDMPGKGAISMEEIGRLLRISALSHDLGKASSSEMIKAVNSPGPYTPIIRTHAEKGVEVLNNNGIYIPQVEEIVRHHHEPWVIEDEITRLLAQIVFIADQIDASQAVDRGYRMGHIEDLNAIRKQVLKYKKEGKIGEIVCNAVLMALKEKNFINIIYEARGDKEWKRVKAVKNSEIYNILFNEDSSVVVEGKDKEKCKILEEVVSELIKVYGPGIKGFFRDVYIVNKYWEGLWDTGEIILPKKLFPLRESVLLVLEYQVLLKIFSTVAPDRPGLSKVITLLYMVSRFNSITDKFQKWAIVGRLDVLGDRPLAELLRSVANMDSYDEGEILEEIGRYMELEVDLSEIKELEKRLEMALALWSQLDGSSRMGNWGFRIKRTINGPRIEGNVSEVVSGLFNYIVNKHWELPSEDRNSDRKYIYVDKDRRKEVLKEVEEELLKRYNIEVVSNLNEIPEGSRFIILVDPLDLDKWDNNRLLYLPLPYSSLSLRIASDILLNNNISKDIRCFVKGFYEVLGVELEEDEVDRLFNEPWWILPMIKKYRSDLEILNEVITQLEKFA